MKVSNIQRQLIAQDNIYVLTQNLRSRIVLGSRPCLDFSGFF